MSSDQTISMSKSKREQWRKIINDWKQSECKTQVEFCQQTGISRKSFYRWRNVFVREGSEQSSIPGFTNVTVLPETSIESGIRINLPNDIHIAVATGFDAITLQRVLGALQ